MRTTKPKAFANYWQAPTQERKKLQTAYWMLCVDENIQAEEMEEEECDCGNCYDCRYAKMFSLPEYEMPLM